MKKIRVKLLPLSVILFLLPNTSCENNKKLDPQTDNNQIHNFSQVAPGQDTSLFKDINLELSVRHILCNRKEIISYDELCRLDSLRYYSFKNIITSLAGIEHCTNLEYLNMNHMRINDLTPVAALINLTMLKLSQNHEIKDIKPLARLTQLQYLDLQANNIQDIAPLANLTNLTYLNLIDNPINDLSALKNMQNLKQLWLGSSPVYDIAVLQYLPNVSVLWLSACAIKEISALQDLLQLRLLFLKYNEIKDISPIADLNSLSRLYLSYNNISDISALSKLFNLNVLKLDHNRIKDISPLVMNNGINHGDFVSLTSNPLSEKSIQLYIPLLRKRGVLVTWP